MQSVEAYYDGRVFIPVKPISAQKNQKALITILDSPELAEQHWRRFFGSMTPEHAKEIEEALIETERVDNDEW